PLFASAGEKEQIDYCEWSSNDRLICGLSFTAGRVRDIVGFDRLVTVGVDGKDLKTLSAAPSYDALGIMQDGGRIIDWQGDASGNAVLMTRQFVPSVTTGTNLAVSAEGLGVERVDPVTLRRQTIEPPRPTAREYISD
ncbi:S9 family peptidase, partial [Pseudomonas sp. FW305-130]